MWFPGVEVGVNQYSGKYMALETQDSPGMTVHKPREQVTDQRSFQLSVMRVIVSKAKDSYMMMINYLIYFNNFTMEPRAFCSSVGNHQLLSVLAHQVIGPFLVVGQLVHETWH